jgi:hypothetical protein
LAPELVRPLSQLRAVILQASAHSDEVSVFLLENARLRGPAPFSILGMRIQNEQSGSSSLFAQPMAIEPIPETEGVRDQGSGIGDQGTENREQGSGISESRAAETEPAPKAMLESEAAAPAKLPRGMLESRMETALASLASLAAPSQPPSATLRQGHLALLKRWYYRPEVRRSGEIFFPDPEGRWPVKAILRGVGRVAAKQLKPSPVKSRDNPIPAP